MSERASGEPREPAPVPAPVVVFGSLNADLVVTTDRLPAPGETVTGGTFARHWGGKGANQAVAAARYGADTAMVGAVGDDELGDGALAALRREGVAVDRVTRRPQAATGVALVVVDRDGENQIAVAPGANVEIDPGGLAELLAQAPRPGVLLVGFEAPATAVQRALQVGGEAGWRLLVNPAPARELSDGFHGSGALLTPNRGELAVLTGSEPPIPTGQLADRARRLSERTTGAPVVVTLGGQGALVVDGQRSWRVEPPAVAARDTTGAGDVFNGVLAGGLAEQRPLEEAVRRAVTAAALSTRAAGARGATPTRQQLARALADHR